MDHTDDKNNFSLDIEKHIFDTHACKWYVVSGRNVLSLKIFFFYRYMAIFTENKSNGKR